MSQLKNDRLIRAMYRQPVDVTPVWVMRQAGRYLPEYRQTRQQAGSFMNLCKTPELACEVTLQPLRRYNLDAAIIFSDILTIPDAMGLELEVIEGTGPVFHRPVRHEKDIQRLSVPDPAQLAYVYEAIRLVQRDLAGKVPLIGFCGSPWTLAAYMVDGNSKAGFPLLKTMKDKEPQLLHSLLNILAKSVAAHLNAQIEAGVQAVMVFDTWGGMLDTQSYLDYSLSYVKQIFNNLNINYNESKVPAVLFTKGGGVWLEEMAGSGCDVLGLDWEVSLQQARAKVGSNIALQGNMNPASLLKTPEHIRKEVGQILASYGHGSGHVFNLGHGITPDVPPEHVTILVDAVHELSQPYHAIRGS